MLHFFGRIKKKFKSASPFFTYSLSLNCYMHQQKNESINLDKIVSALENESSLQELTPEEKALFHQLNQSRGDKEMLFSLENLSAEAAWQQVYLKLAGAADTPVISLPTRRKQRFGWAAAAVLIGLLLLAGNWFIFQNSARTVIQTQLGEFREVVLPDGSLVKLHPASRLRFAKKWNKSDLREVWLEGEAFLEVKHLHRQGARVASGDRFVVHTDDLNIEVLGTSFSVNVRHQTSKVIL